MNGPVQIKANAKINLTLDITRALPDGYHAIHTVMQSVTLHDTLLLTPARQGVTLAVKHETAEETPVPEDGRNLAVIAAKAFYEAARIPPAVHVDLTKRIPSRAGLGGGSADAAAVLCGLNEMYGFCVPHDILLKIALKIGADVPFCLVGGTMACFNKGEVMAKTEPFSSYVVIAKPSVGVSTAEAFRIFDEKPALTHPDTDLFVYHLMRREHEQAFGAAGNLFEQLCPPPPGESIKNRMRENGAFYASMSGSGSAYFGLFRSFAAASRASDALREDGLPFCCVCRAAAAGAETEKIG